MTAPIYQMVMHSGPTPGMVFPLEKANMFIGRDLGNDVVINDAEVSRRHARLVMQGDSFVLEDLGSTNGTSVGGARLTGPRLLKAGDTITLGEKISLSFDVVLTNPDATVIAQRPPVMQATVQPAAPGPQPVQPRMPPPPPVQQVAPLPPAYAGYVPAAPKPASKKKFPVWIIILLVVILLLVCVCGVALWYIDSNSLWCNVLPFLPGCQ
jgi:hypothetical protein